ncbi:hypothetical protein GCM10020000_57770 [Streptomyces olivoverticillatus]
MLRDRSDVAAYAAYRMPATFEAVRSALEAFRDRLPDWAPASHVDIGGGTGAATWAVAAAWPEGGHRTTVLDWAGPALELGEELARTAASEALRTASWQRATIGADLTLPEADLITVSYVLNELTEADRRAVTEKAARAARAVVIVEPGTPDGYRRIIEARSLLIEEGFTVAAPCPHSAGCPIEGTDWCHFSARVSRSSLHRQVKGGSLPYEDEKFSYVAAVRGAGGAGRDRAGRAQAADPQGPGPPGAVHAGGRPDPRDGDQAARPPLPGRAGRGLGDEWPPASAD